LDRRARIALAQTAASAAIWGTSFPVVTIGLRGGLDPGVFVFLRFAIAAPPMIIAAAALRKGLAPLIRGREVWILGTLNAVGFVSQYVGQLYTPATVAALLVNLSVVFAAAGGAIFLKEKIGVPKAVGIVLALIGTMLVTTKGDLLAFGGSQVLGDSLYLVSAVTWAGYVVYAKERIEKMHLDPLLLAAGIVLITAILTFPVALLGGFRLPVSGPSILAVLYTALLNTAVAFVLYQQGLRYLAAGTSALVLVLEVVVALLVSAGFLGESITPLAGAGALMIVAALVAVSGLEWRQNRQ
jgi:drug/metabolite transporter (DMT)-like permease